MTLPIRVALLGAGVMARHHIRQMLTPALVGSAREMQSTTLIGGGISRKSFTASAIGITIVTSE